jgi:hypothetical protein
MNEEKDQESSALDEVMVARIEIEGIGVAADEKEMTDSVSALPGVREVKIENGVIYVTYDPLDTAEKEDRGSGAGERKYGESCNHRHRNSASLRAIGKKLRSQKVPDSVAGKAIVDFLTLLNYYPCSPRNGVSSRV